MEWMSSSINDRSAFAKACGVDNFLKSAPVTLLTCLSVHYADKMVATSNWNGVWKSSWVLTSGYVVLSILRILSVRFLSLSIGELPNSSCSLSVCMGDGIG